MRIYMDCSEPRKSHTMFVTPAHDSDSSEFKDPQGKPISFAVQFEYGKADVPDNLGRWMIDHGLAKSSLIILPARNFIRSLAR